MLLSTLNRKEKLKFLDLALHMVYIDGKPSDLEQRLLNMMLAEVGDNIVSEYFFKLSDTLEETILFFDVLDLKTRKIVYYNLLKIALNESFYNATEHDFLEMIRTRFHIHEAQKNQIIKAVYKEKDLRSEIEHILGN
jgi:uncharacterized tellurite resistance protein B-like protein